jgi:DNA uptake protein ComE-like DNA-binding protein
MRMSTEARLVATLAACFLTAACTQKQDPDTLRRETAHMTAIVKQDTKAVAEGVRDGLKSDKRLDLNSAARNELLDLPGVTADRADRIIANRPFGSTRELVSRHIFSEAEYDRIEGRVKIEKPSAAIKWKSDEYVRQRRTPSQSADRVLARLPS